MGVRSGIVACCCAIAGLIPLTHAQAAGDDIASIAIGNVVPGMSTVPVKVRSLRDMRYRDMVRQQNDFTCGAAALATILQQAYGRPVGEADVVSDMLSHATTADIKERGFSLLDLKRYVERIGLRGRGYRVDTESLRAIKIPVITLQNTNGYAHFVVLKRVEGDTVFIADPALGHRQIPLKDFATSWNGVVFAVLGNGLREHNALLDSAKSLAMANRAGIVTRTLPPQREFGLLGLDSF